MQFHLFHQLIHWLIVWRRLVIWRNSVENWKRGASDGLCWRTAHSLIGKVKTMAIESHKVKSCWTINVALPVPKVRPHSKSIRAKRCITWRLTQLRPWTIGYAFYKTFSDEIQRNCYWVVTIRNQRCKDGWPKWKMDTRKSVGPFCLAKCFCISRHPVIV